MKDKRKVSFDLEKATESVMHYSKATDSNCIIVDTEGNILFDTKFISACEFCTNAQESIASGESICRVARVHAAYDAMRFGGKYIFLCPLGLVNWASPITVDGQMTGAFIAGSRIMMKPDWKVIEETFDKHGLSKESWNTLYDYLTVASRIEPGKVTSLSEMLFITSCFLSDIRHFTYLEEQENQRNLSSVSDYIQHLKTLEDDKMQEGIYPFEKEAELLLAVKTGNEQEAQKILNEIIAYLFFKNGSDLKFIKTRIIELLVLLSRTVLDSSIDQEQILQLNYRYLGEINELKNIDDFTSRVNKIFNQFFNYLNTYRDMKNADFIHKSIDYIKNNYMRKITLEEVADAVHLSPNYFSRVFKDEMKINFIDYLNQVRIEKSMRLLLNVDLSIKDIASLVGFLDQSYFSKVFRKNMGITPAKFRKSHGKVIPVSELEILR
jgi:AraC-like DNA-binding protein/ligand-binding sensor protein